MSASALDPTALHEGPWTEESFLALTEDRRVELLDGSLLVSPWPNHLHQWLCSQLCHVLNQAAPRGWRALESINLRVAPGRILVPDLTVLATRDLSRLVSPASDARMSVEVTSPGNAYVDRGIKPQLYAEAGIPHYLRIELDGDRPTVLAFALDGAAYAERARFEPGETTVLDRPFPASFDLAALVES